MERTELAPGAEWGDAVQVRANFGLDRGHLYYLVDEKLIESKNVRRRGMQRGKRLYNLASVRRYIESQGDDMSPIFANSPKGLKLREAKRKSRAVAKAEGQR
jgi:hypothetical protein